MTKFSSIYCESTDIAEDPDLLFLLKIFPSEWPRIRQDTRDQRDVTWGDKSFRLLLTRVKPILNTWVPRLLVTNHEDGSGSLHRSIFWLPFDGIMDVGFCLIWAFWSKQWSRWERHRFFPYGHVCWWFPYKWGYGGIFEHFFNFSTLHFFKFS
jgi:hypothetical protein